MKRYDEEFRKDAVEMLINGDRLIRRLARELGVSPDKRKQCEMMLKKTAGILRKRGELSCLVEWKSVS